MFPPTAGAPAGAESSGLDAAMDSVATGQDAPGSEGGADEGVDDPGQSLDEAMDEVDQTPDVDQPSADDPADPNLKADEKPLEDGVKPWGKDYHVTKPRMDSFIAHRNFAQAIQKFAPTVEKAQEHYTRAGDLVQMAHDINDSDGGQDNFIGFWKNHSPSGFASITEKIVDSLQTSHPALYSKVESQVLDGYWAKQYAKAEEVQDAKLFLEIQKAQYAVDGKYKPTMGKYDPLQAERDSLAKRRAEFDKRETTHRDSTWNNTNQRITQQKDSTLLDMVSKALEPATASKSFSKEKLDAYRDRIINVVKERMAGDFEWTHNHNLSHGNIKQMVMSALKNNQRVELTPHVRALVDEYTSFARPVVLEVARTLIGEETAAAVRANQQKHQRLQNGQRPSANGNKPATAPFQKAKPQSQTFDDLFDAVGAGKA